MYEPDYPVIWVNYGGNGSMNCPFGEVINID